MKHPIAITKNYFRHMHSCTEWHLEYSSPKCCKGMFVHQRHTLDAAYARKRKLREKLARESFPFAHLYEKRDGRFAR